MGRWSLGGGLLVLVMVILQIDLGFSEERYTVKFGDSLDKISRLYGVSVGVLKSTNHLVKENLKVRQVLLIPTSKAKKTKESLKKGSGRADSYMVRKRDSLYTISKSVGLSVKEIKQINQLRRDNVSAGQRLLISPPPNGGEEVDEELGEVDEIPEEESVESKEDRGPTSEPPGTWRDPEERNLFVRVAKTFLGVPYRLGGSTLKGIDCSAFVRKIYAIFNTHLPRTTWEQFRFGKLIGKDELEAGDLVFFKVPAARAGNRHVGIYIGHNEFVHASSRNREVRVDNLNAPYFNQRFLNGVRVKELDRDL